jgi:hypothetical protein
VDTTFTIAEITDILNRAARPAATPTRTTAVTMEDVYRAHPGSLNFICCGGYWRETFLEQVGNFFAEAADVEPVGDTIVYFRDPQGAPYSGYSATTGEVTMVDGGRLVFTDGSYVALATVVAVKVGNQADVSKNALTPYTENPDLELPLDAVEALGLDGTGRDGDDRFPYTWRKLTEVEQGRLRSAVAFVS